MQPAKTSFLTNIKMFCKEKGQLLSFKDWFSQIEKEKAPIVHALKIIEKKRPPFYDSGVCYKGLTECEVSCSCGAKWIQNFVEEGDKCIRELE